MIAYFPEIYPDELIYSVLARFYLHGGYMAYIYAAKDLFVDFRTRPEIEFLNRLRPEIVTMLCHKMPMEELVKKHTMFPYYARFLSCGRRNSAFQALCGMAGNYNNLLLVPKQRNGEERYLRYCPLCAKADRERFGETYWHRDHQMMWVSVCPVHGCRLIDSPVSCGGRVSPNLAAAEQEIREKEPVIYGNDIEKQLSEYVAEVFQADMDISSPMPVSQFLHTKMAGTKYLSVRGGQKNIQLFYDDFMAFYRGLRIQGITERWQMEKVFTSYRSYTFEICQAAMFLGVSAEALIKMELPEKPQEQLFDEKVIQMHDSGMGINQIARELGVSSRTVRMVGKQPVRTVRKRSFKGGVRAKDWEQVDRESLPSVKEAVSQLQGKAGGRPHRVTEAAVCKALGFPDKRLLLLPKCREEVLRHKEAQEQYWARECVWAVSKIEREGKTLNWKQIRVLTNMRKENFTACLPYLEDMLPSEQFEMVKMLL